MDTTRFLLSPPKIKSNIVSSIMVLCGFSVFVLLVYFFFPIGIDFAEAYIPAARTVLSGQSPYNSGKFFNPPWAVIPFIPFIFFPIKLASALATAIAASVYYYVARKLGAGRWATIAILLSVPVLLDLHLLNIEWLVALGLVFPPQIGLFFILIKPQTGAAIALFWLVEAWREGGWMTAVKRFAPVGLAFLLSFALYGLWPFKMTELVLPPWNASLFPLSIPIGLLLITKSLKERQIRFAMMASPFFSPYLSTTSYAILLLGFAPSALEAWAVSSGFYLVLAYLAVSR